MPEQRLGKRSALIVATSSYRDESFRRLRAPARDAAELAGVLGDPGVGGFEVESISDPTSQRCRIAIEEHLSRQGIDTLVVYLSGHGKKDARGRLHFVLCDTVQTRLAATAIEAQWLVDRLDECRARQQVVILDCCFSGAFAAGTKSGEDDLADSLAQLAGHGRGRIVLTASGATEYSFEGYALPGAAIAGSAFTAGLIDGLRSGHAVREGRELISVDDAFAYASDFVVRHGFEQTPRRWAYGVHGDIWLARTLTGRAAPTPYTPHPVPEILPPPPTASRPSPVAGRVVGWGGRNPSIVRAMATGVEFGKVTVPSGLRDVTAVAAGARHGLALTIQGDVVAWGENAFGQARVPRRLGQARAVSAGAAHNLAIRTDGTVAAWGNNNGGQCRVPRSVGEVVAVAAGGWHSVARRPDGTVVAWGENFHGQTRTPAGLRDVVEVAAGEAHNLALRADGTVVAWGRDDYGQARAPLDAFGVVAVAAGATYSIALRDDGKLISWGQAPRGSPPHLAGSSVQLSAGESHCLALTSDGILHAWGDDTYEQCAVPTGLGGVLAISAGGVFSLALVAPLPTF
jgi:hypothetical protein